MRKNVTRRQAAGWMGAALWAASGGAVAQSARKPAAAAAPWRLVVNEAVTGETNTFVLTTRYLPLAEYIGQHARGHKVEVEAIVDIPRFIQVAQAKDKPEFVFGKSVNQLAKLVRDHGYQPLVRRADPYKAAFIVPGNSPFKTLSDAARAAIVMPDEYAATTALARAELRRQNVAGVQEKHVKFQEAVAQHVKAGLGQVGVVNPTTAKKWADEGGRVLAETQGVANWSVLAGPQVDAATVQQLRQALLAMNTQAPEALKSLGIKEWAAAEAKDYLALLEYTRE